MHHNTTKTTLYQPKWDPFTNKIATQSPAQEARTMIGVCCRRGCPT